MPQKKTSVTIYTGDLSGITIKEGNIELTTSAEKEVVKLLEARKIIDVILETFKDSVGNMMIDTNTNLLELRDIKITRSVNGRKYNLDPDNPIDPQFVKEVSYQIPDSKAIENYHEMEGTVPKGILENARKQKIDIELIEEE